MSGYKTYQRFEELRENLSKLGLAMSMPEHRWNEDVIALVPKDLTSLPVYSRSTNIFVGNINQVEDWLRGVEWARSYDKMIKLSDEKKREAKEESIRHDNLVKELQKEPKSL